MKDFSTILFATDFSETSEYAFDYACTLAKKFNSKLIVMHVINEPVDLRGFYVPHISFDSLEKEIEDSAEKMMKKFCSGRLGDLTSSETAIVAGIPYDEIIEMADKESVSLIVLGTHGRAGLDHLLFGSTAERVVRRSRCPVMTIRPPVSEE
jgi:nucleotide-binding universal stress UspA family protein